MGGTTHPFLTLKFLTDGTYESESGQYLSQTGTPKYYFASDTLQQESYRGLLPSDLIDIAVNQRIHFHPAIERGVVFHLMGALSQYGKLGLVCIGDNLQQAQFLCKKDPFYSRPRNLRISRISKAAPLTLVPD